jgi:hypothetical protein
MGLCVTFSNIFPHPAAGAAPRFAREWGLGPQQDARAPLLPRGRRDRGMRGKDRVRTPSVQTLHLRGAGTGVRASMHEYVVHRQLIGLCVTCSSAGSCSMYIPAALSSMPISLWLACA